MNRDNTSFDQANFFGCEGSRNFPYFEGLDIENDWLFLITNRAFQIWDISTPAKAAQPVRIANACSNFAEQHPIPHFPPGSENAKFTLLDVDAPPNRDDVVTTVLRNLGGFVIWDTTDKTDPEVLYQDHGSDVTQVYATTIGTQHYAFAANEDQGMHYYNLSRAQSLNTVPCTEIRPDEPNNSCAGVFLGKIGDFRGAGFVDGYSDNARGEHLVVFSGLGQTGAGLEMWDVSNPLFPRRTMSDNGPYFGLAMWKNASDGVLHLAVRTLSDSRIYRDTGGCMTSSTACSLNSLTLVWSAPIKVGLRKFVTYSESNGTPFLYFGSTEQCASSQSPEVLYDVTDPSNPREVGQGYWDFYYRTNLTQLPGPGDNRAGFNFVGPRMGKFNGKYFYRAGFSIFDVHEWTSADPTLIVEGPEENIGFFDDPVDFDAIAFSCTPDPSYSWTASGGGQVSGSGATVSVTWPAASGAGEKTVSVTNSGCFGAMGSTTIDLQDPTPRVEAVSLAPQLPRVCETVVFTAEQVTGKPPITFAWEVRDESSAIVASPSGVGLTSFEWPTGSASPGAYTAEVSLTNDAVTVAGAENQASVGLQLAAADLEILSGPTYDGAPADPAGGTVQFRVVTSGATEWTWDFGDGTVKTYTDPEEGQNPVHAYENIGQYNVTVNIINCVDTEGVTSDPPLDVTINQIEALEILNFQALCSFGICTIGDSVTFEQSFMGSPERYQYDWNGDGTFEQSSTSPITEHTYTAAANQFRPAVKISRGAENVTFIHVLPLIVSAANASISISGSSSRLVNQSGTYTARATNCTPSANGWTWTAGSGGFVTGSTTSERVTITWTTAGSKNVTARNSACGAVSGSLIVSVSGGGSSITVSGPSALQVNQSATYSANATGCSSSPSGWTWTASGGGSISGNTSSNRVTISWSVAGTKTVTARNSGCGSSAGTRIVSVTSGGGGPLNANFTFTPTNPLAGQSVSFDGSSSTGDIGLYSWNFGDGTGSASGRTVNHVFAAAGSFDVRLSIQEAGCGTAPTCFSEEVKTVVVGSNDPEIAVAGPNLANINASEDFTAIATNCTPSSNGWTWTSDGGEVGGEDPTGDQVTITWDSVGEKTVTARNTACGAALGSLAVTVSEPLAAAFSFDPAEPVAGQEVTFDAGESTGNIVSYLWDFGDETTGGGLTVAHAFTEPGSYEVELTVAEDNCGSFVCFNTATQTVEVGAAAEDQTLVLPYFVVDTDDNAGLTTFFAVRNESDNPVTVRYEYFTSAGADPFTSSEGELDPRQVVTVDLRAILEPPIISSLKAGLMTGWVRVTALAVPPGETALSGDYFRLDGPNNFASGENLLTGAPPDLCSAWNIRFFAGGAFNGGTDFTFFVPDNPGDGEPVVLGTAYNEAGAVAGQISLDNFETSFEINTADLDFGGEAFGAIEWTFRDGLVGNISGTFKALEKFSVGLAAVCQDVVGSEPQPQHSVVVPGYAVDTATVGGLTTFFAVRNASDDDLTVMYLYFDTDGLPIASATEFLGLEARSVRTRDLSNVEGLQSDEAGIARGYVRMTVVDPTTFTPTASLPVLSGDYFRIDPANDFASGSNVLVSEGLPRDLCQHWTLRFLNGGGFDGGTDLTFYVPQHPGDGEPIVLGDVYDQDGVLVQQIALSNTEAVFEVNTADLGLETEFGAIEWRFRDGIEGHINGTFKALGKFSLGVPAICRDPMM